MATKAAFAPMVSLFILALVAVPAASAAPVGRTGPSAPEQEVSRTVAPRLSRLSGTTVTAHRGGALEVPENSMQGMTATRRRGYAHVLDADIRRLRDGTLVAMHDDTLDRTTDQHGKVGALDWKAWQKVRLTPKRSLPGTWRPERPPAAREILDRFGGDILLMLELKDPEGLPRLARLIRERQLTRSVLVESNDPRVAAAAHEEGLLTAVWRSARQAAGDRPERWKDFVTMLSIDHRATAGDVRRAVRSGITYVWSHTVNTRAARDRMLKLGCEGIVTDRPGSLAPVGAGT
ncbi:glycerophosphodiester phosphodiesterase family protein [Streptomyces sp. NPDC007083]|uniref:glycerophosphodiester phosphodiesterase n=1 Tax=unclassified Streptomyces TaxID=2593676 RepID=UPI0033E11FA2